MERRREPQRPGNVTLHKAGLKFSDMDTGTLVRLKDFMRIPAPDDQKEADHFRPGPLRFSIFPGRKAMLNYPAKSPVRQSAGRHARGVDL
jgi:hypothetical protein